MRRLTAALTMVFGLTALALAQTPATTNMQILRDKVKADKKLVVAANMELTDAEAKEISGLFMRRTRRTCSRSTSAWRRRSWRMPTPTTRGRSPTTTAKKLLDEALGG